ncbi:neuropeptide FF receptor 2-like isoform X1 [Ostrea edulis]|uniref:neuropeptide FF receptor 2-like isoform X1 n=1 Tax=Ostrea edulis TaxID=37623 RepID=UPI0024AFF46F|nr:neuropeptide FF receptor 2-like isoform X1 [Ostrea edulis]
MWPKCTSVAGQTVILTVNYTLYANTDGAPIKPIPYLEIFLKIFFYLLVFLLDLIGNSVVIFTIYANKRMRTSSNILIVNLAVSDILVGCFCMWVHLGNQVSHNWPFGSFLCKFETFVQVVAVVSSVVTLTSLSIERFLAVMFPMKGKLSNKMLTFLVVFSWIAAIGTSAPNLKVRQKLEVQWRNRRDVWCDEIWPRFYTDTKCNSDQPGRRSYYVFLSVFMYFIPMIVMMVAYGLMGLKLFLRRIPGHEIHATNEAHCNARKKVLRMFFVVLTAFVVCWTPQQALILYMVYRDTTLMLTIAIEADVTLPLTFPWRKYSTQARRKMASLPAILYQNRYIQLNSR